MLEIQLWTYPYPTYKREAEEYPSFVFNYFCDVASPSKLIPKKGTFGQPLFINFAWNGWTIDLRSNTKRTNVVGRSRRSHLRPKTWLRSKKSATSAEERNTNYGRYEPAGIWWTDIFLWTGYDVMFVAFCRAFTGQCTPPRQFSEAPKTSRKLLLYRYIEENTFLGFLTRLGKGQYNEL